MGEETLGKTAERLREMNKQASIARQADLGERVKAIKAPDFQSLADRAVGFDTQQFEIMGKIQRRMAEKEESQMASGYHKRLIELANDFDATLDAEHEVGVRLVSFGQMVTFHLGDIGYYNPSLIIFHGRNEQDEQVQLIQHISQISILFIKMERLDMSKPKSRIGFASEQSE